MLEQHFEKLAYFAAVAEHGGFAAAARRLHISQSSLSMSVKIIEDELGTELFERSRKGVTLTPSGHRMLQVYRSLRAGVRDLESEIKSMNAATARSLVVGTHDTVATGLWPELVRGVADIPGLSLILNTNPSAGRLMQSLRERAFDCILVAEPDHSNDWEIVNVGFISYGLYVSGNASPDADRAFLIENGVIAHHKALAGKKVVLGERLLAAGIPTNPKLQVDSLETVKEMVLEGLGPGVMPCQLSRRYERRGLIKRLHSPWPGKRSPLQKSGRHHP
jgi:DNA-binding transcriptional LysR family regulator